MPVKMISDMPLPMPRSVICSPSHMMNAVPVVSVRIVIRMKPKPGLITIPALHASAAPWRYRTTACIDRPTVR